MRKCGGKQEIMKQTDMKEKLISKLSYMEMRREREEHLFRTSNGKRSGRK